MSNSKLVKVVFYFTPETAMRLQDYLEKRYGNRRMRSITVEQAVRLYLDTQEALSLGGDYAGIKRN